MLLISLGHSRAAIYHAHHTPAVSEGNLDKGRVVGRVLAVVLDKVGKCNIEQIGVAERGNEPVVIVVFVAENQFDGIVRVRSEDELPHIEQEFVEPHLSHAYLFLAVIGLGEVEQSVYQAAHALGVEQHVVHGLTILVAAAFLLQRHIELGGQGCKRCSQFMGHIADKLALRVEGGLR